MDKVEKVLLALVVTVIITLAASAVTCGISYNTHGTERCKAMVDGGVTDPLLLYKVCGKLSGN